MYSIDILNHTACFFFFFFPSCLCSTWLFRHTSGQFLSSGRVQGSKQVTYLCIKLCIAFWVTSYMCNQKYSEQQAPILIAYQIILLRSQFLFYCSISKCSIYTGSRGRISDTMCQGLSWRLGKKLKTYKRNTTLLWKIKRQCDHQHKNMRKTVS